MEYELEELRTRLVSRRAILQVAGVGALGLAGATLLGCGTSEETAEPKTEASPSGAAVAPSAAPATTVAAPADTLKPLKIAPEKGFVGAQVTITGEGLPAGKVVELTWATRDGGFDMKPSAETVEYYDRVFTEKRVALAQGTVGSDGKLSVATTIPEDYGDTHDIFAVVDGKDVARGGFAVVRNVTLSSQSGPIGSPIEITVKGLGWGAFTNTMGVLWDNNYAGFLSAVTTRGTAVGRIRAAGAPGVHVLRVTDASAAVPYLNTEQSPRKLPQFRFDFRVTSDDGPPPAVLEWPDPERIAKPSAMTTASAQSPAEGVQASFSPASGPILSKTTLKATGLPAGAPIDLIWMSVKGNRVSPSGWNLTEASLAKANAGGDGTLALNVDIPDDLGGWHVVRLVREGKVLAEAPYFLERSIAGVSPMKVKAGETFTAQVKGIGWTEFDNGIAITYDNAFMGYACGFNSQGDVTLNLVASGQPGTHLLDFYPMLFSGHGKGPWNYSVPFLAYARDFPGLSLGYRLPAYRMAIEVVV